MSEQHNVRGTTTTGRWSVDVDNSTADFTVRNFGKTVHGTVPIIAGVVAVGADGQLSAVDASLDLSGIQTGIPRRDKDLRGPKLLDLDNHPVMTFTADRFSGQQIEGVLSARGTTTRVAGTVEPTVSPAGELLMVRATGNFDRRSLGISAPPFLIGREISVTVVARMSAVQV